MMDIAALLRGGLLGQNNAQAEPTAPTGLLGIDLSRPIIKNRDGSFSTERTITIEADGRHFLIPTIVKGVQLNPDMAILAWRSGDNPHVGVFNSAKEADAAAKARSKMIGQVRKP